MSFCCLRARAGCREQWAEAFPDRRTWAEIPREVILATEVAARFAQIYSQRKSSYVLRSARVLGALGYSPSVLEPGDGLSGRSTSQDQLYSEDVLRKLLGKLERQATITDEDRAAAVQGGAVVKVRQRASRRAVKQPALDELATAARSHAAVRQLFDWYNESVGPGLLGMRSRVRDGGCTFWIRQWVGVALETGTYEASGVVADDDGRLWRGDKLATLLDTTGIITEVAVGPMGAARQRLVRLAAVGQSGVASRRFAADGSGAVGWGDDRRSEASAPGGCDRAVALRYAVVSGSGEAGGTSQPVGPASDPVRSADRVCAQRRARLG